MSFDISIKEFNQQFQLYQKGERYNLNLFNFDLNRFIVKFFKENIEDLNITYSERDSEIIYNKKLNNTSFNAFFEDIENLLTYKILNISGYFISLDLYFSTNKNFLEINYINRNILFDLVDQLLQGIDVNYKSRLKTELLLNMEFD